MYEAFSHASQQTVALKVVASSEPQAWNEVDILKQVAACPHIVHQIAVYVFDGMFCEIGLLVFFFSHFFCCQAMFGSHSSWLSVRWRVFCRCAR